MLCHVLRFAFLVFVYTNRFFKQIFSYDHFKMWVAPLTFNCTTHGFDDFIRAIFLRNPLKFKSGMKLFCFNMTVDLSNPLG